MRKNEANKTEYVKHTRNSKYGRRGHNKRVRASVRRAVRKES